MSTGQGQGSSRLMPLATTVMEETEGLHLRTVAPEVAEADAAEAEVQAGPRNPFAAVARVFAADDMPETFPFELYGHQCYVTIARMDNNAMQKFRTIGQGLEVDATARTVEKATFREAAEERVLQLFQTAVPDFCLPHQKRDKDGEPTTVEIVYSKNPKGGQRLSVADRAEVFRGLDPDFGGILIRECCRKNGLDPLAFGIGAQKP